MIKDTGDRLEKAIQELKTLTVRLPFYMTSTAPIDHRHDTGFHQVEARVLRRQGAPRRRERTRRSDCANVQYMTEEFNSLQAIGGRPCILRSCLQTLYPHCPRTHLRGIDFGLITPFVSPFIPRIRNVLKFSFSFSLHHACAPLYSFYSRVSVSTPQHCVSHIQCSQVPPVPARP